MLPQTVALPPPIELPVTTVTAVTTVTTVSDTTSTVRLMQPYERFAIGGHIYTVCQMVGDCVPTVHVPLPERITGEWV